jgi:GTP cyclohydrolase I
MPLPLQSFEMIRQGVHMILEGLGEDTSKEGHFRDTPMRVARMMDRVLDANFTEMPEMTTFTDPGYYGMIMVHKVPFYSFCAHHMLPFMGHFALGYLPKDDKILGLSKLVRIFRYGCKRLTTQEDVTQRAVDGLYQALDGVCTGAACYVNAEHTCMSLRGVQAHGARTTTTAWKGEFQTNLELREHFLPEARK